MITFDRFTLDNGLTVLVHRDRNTPMVAMNVLYKVGSRDEYPDKTGFAHLFEHLMFGGSLHVPKFDEPLQKAGGDNNAFTNNDFTNYYLTIPKNNLETAFWLESDRMLSLAFTPKSLEVQRQVVSEEFKQNYLNQPYGDIYLLLKPLAFKHHPYQWNTIGKDISHIEQATMADVKSFYAKYYNPDNAILSVAGNVSVDEIEELSQKWFGPIARGNPLERNYPVEPVQHHARTEIVERYVPQHAIYKAWVMPARTARGFYVTDLISDVLSNGNSSRFYQNLVKKQKLFTELNAFVTGDQDKGLFIIAGRLTNGVGRRMAEEAIDHEIRNLKENLVEEREIEKIKNKIEANLVFGSLSVLNKAMQLGYYEMLGDAALWMQENEKYRSVTREEIRNMARDLLREEASNTLFYSALNIQN
ncbi:MAG: pitrilysin family protein [bacterium]|jgi:zinc protease